MVSLRGVSVHNSLSAIARVVINLIDVAQSRLLACNLLTTKMEVTWPCGHKWPKIWGRRSPLHDSLLGEALHDSLIYWSSETVLGGKYASDFFLSTQTIAFLDAKLWSMSGEIELLCLELSLMNHEYRTIQWTWSMGSPIHSWTQFSFGRC